MQYIHTKRLTIRNFKEDDARALFEMVIGYMASPFAAYDHAWPTSQEEITKVTAWFAEGDDYLAVCLKESDFLIGMITLNPEGDPSASEYQLGYLFNFDYHGHGYATEACQMLLEYVFHSLKVAQVISGTAQANTPSRNLLERLGFCNTSENTASFHKDKQGQPIEFPAYTYTLTKEMWEVSHLKTLEKDVQG